MLSNICSNIKFNNNTISHSIQRSHYLYMLGKIQQDKLKKKKNEIKKINDENEMKKCTFKPKLISDAERRNKVGEDIIKRNNIWDEKKKEKLKKMYKEKVKENLSQCKFVPEIVSYI